MCLLVLKNCFCLSFTGCRSEKAFTQEKKMQRKDFRPWNVIRETQEGFFTEAITFNTERDIQNKLCLFRRLCKQSMNILSHSET